MIPSTAQDLNEYRGIVSDETLLGLIPFVDNPEEEMRKLQEQKESNMELYQFPVKEEEDEEESAES